MSAFRHTDAEGSGPFGRWVDLAYPAMVVLALIIVFAGWSETDGGECHREADAWGGYEVVCP